jgi:hypothetical protein
MGSNRGAPSGEESGRQPAQRKPVHSNIRPAPGRWYKPIIRGRNFQRQLVSFRGAGHRSILTTYDLMGIGEHANLRLPRSFRNAIDDRAQRSSARTRIRILVRYLF